MSHTEIHRWQEEFRVNAQRDHAELLEQLSDIQEGQNITHAVLEEQSAEMKRMMGMMQKVCDSHFCMKIANCLHSVDGRK